MMNSHIKIVSENTSTPKRRRLGTSRVLPKDSLSRNNSPIHRQVTSTIISSTRCESPPLPCNQVEYLYESANSSSIPCSPGVLDHSAIKDVENWKTLDASNFNNNIPDDEIHESINEISNNLSSDILNSKLEHELSQNQILTSRCEKHFREEIEESFDIINQSICDIEKKVDKSSMFETKDSFLLDIKESGIIAEEKVIKCDEFPKPKTEIDSKLCDENSFYGLPLVTKSLFKTFRNIDKFYDWQEECLNLEAIKKRRNLIYALPTSGGKTLVAEVLMLNEVLNRKQNTLFILPFVAIVQEKIWALSPFAVKLDFLVEEYAAGKGHIPPKKRRKKNSIYVATIEKGLALVRSLIELDRLHEIGLIVVDELHLIGEPGRGGTLETLLTTVIFANSKFETCNFFVPPEASPMCEGIQIVGMSATIGNLSEIAGFLKADVFQRQFRPVELVEYVKLGDVLHKIVWGDSGMELVPHRELAYDYSSAATSLDPDWLGGLVSEVVPQASCLVFCPTKRNCENVAALLCKLQRREMTCHRVAERQALSSALLAEGAGVALATAARAGVAFHHAGLAADERSLLEAAFRSGVISVLCCTSTLAAGVNLPAQRVIVRAPLVGRDLISLGAYRQMAGRAGRAGVCHTGESIIICGPREWPQLRAVLSGGLPPARSVLRGHAGGLLLSAVGLRLATTRLAAREIMACTLLGHSSEVNIKEVCDETLESLLKSGALEIVPSGRRGDPSPADDGNCYVYDDSQLAVSVLGKAAIKGGLELSVAKQLLLDLKVASKALVLMGSLHLLYLVTPHDGAGVRPDYRHYYSLYDGLDEEGLRTAKILGITEMNAIRMMTGKPITNVSEKVLCRFYLALMLHDLWNQMPCHLVAEKYQLSRGTVQSVLCSSSSLSSSCGRVCGELGWLWPFTALFSELTPRLQHCAAPELHHLMELPAVKKARAIQLLRAGYKRVEDLAKASAEDLVQNIDHLSRTAANHLISAARMMLIEKVENLRAEAEDVMEELKL